MVRRGDVAKIHNQGSIELLMTFIPPIDTVDIAKFEGGVNGQS